MTNLTEADCKLLTEMLRECWHEPQWTDHRGIICLKCNEEISWPPYYRTFLTGNDMVAVKEAIIETGKWGEFWWYAAKQWSPETPRDVSYSFVARLMHPPHFCKLVAEWYKQLK